MSISRGIARASPRLKSRAAEGRMLTLESAEGWGVSCAAMSTDRAMKISTVNRCVEVLSTSMAVLPVYITDEGTHMRLPEHRLGRILWERPNEDMTPFDYSRLMLANEVLKGNAYAWVHRDRSTGHVRELLPLPPDYVSGQVDPNGRVWYRYTAPRTGEIYRLDQEDVIHYKAYSRDGLEGISVLRRAAQTMATAEAAEKYQTAVYQNGGRPSGVLTTEADIGGRVEVKNADGTKETITKKERLRREWEKVHRGPDNAFRLAVLDLGLKYQPIAMSNADAQFVESSEIRVADLCRFFGVPLHLAYAGKQSYSSNEQNGIEFVNYTLLGYETQWRQEDSYKLLLPSSGPDGCGSTGS